MITPQELMRTFIFPIQKNLLSSSAVLPTNYPAAVVAAANDVDDGHGRVQDLLMRGAN